jgi:hypothetical protein
VTALPEATACNRKCNVPLYFFSFYRYLLY